MSQHLAVLRSAGLVRAGATDRRSSIASRTSASSRPTGSSRASPARATDAGRPRRTRAIRGRKEPNPMAIQHATDDDVRAARAQERASRSSSTSGPPGAGRARWSRPEMEKIAAKYEGAVDVVKVDVDANPRISQAFNIMSIPTIAFFRPGQQPMGMAGARPMEALEAQFGLAQYAPESAPPRPERRRRPRRRHARAPTPPVPTGGVVDSGLARPGSVARRPRRPAMGAEEPRLGAVDRAVVEDAGANAHPIRPARATPTCRASGGLPARPAGPAGTRPDRRRAPRTPRAAIRRRTSSSGGRRRDHAADLVGGRSEDVGQRQVRRGRREGLGIGRRALLGHRFPARSVSRSRPRRGSRRGPPGGRRSARSSLRRRTAVRRRP